MNKGELCNRNLKAILSVKQLGQYIQVVLLPTSDELQYKVFNLFVGRLKSRKVSPLMEES